MSTVLHVYFIMAALVAVAALWSDPDVAAREAAIIGLLWPLVLAAIGMYLTFAWLVNRGFR